MAESKAALQCPSCNGVGTMTGFVCGPTSGGVRTMACLLCKGLGEILAERAEWMRLGELLRTDRIREGYGGRERARMLGLTRLELNDIEHGKVDPRVALT